MPSQPLAYHDAIREKSHQRFTMNTSTSVTPRPLGRLFFLAALFLLLGLGGGWLVLRGAGGTVSYQGTVIQSPEPAADFAMTSANTGGEVKLSDFRGRVTLLYYGYTLCPDVCPATMLELRQAMRELGATADEIQVVMVTIDPERDTAERLAPYVTQFDERFIGLTGTEEQLLAATTQFGIYYERIETPESQLGYLMNHSAYVLAIDKEGYLRVIYPFGTTGTQIAADMRRLVRE